MATILRGHANGDWLMAEIFPTFAAMVVAQDEWRSRERLLRECNVPQETLELFERLATSMRMLEGPRASGRFVLDTLAPELAPWPGARDAALDAVIKGYLTPPDNDWVDIMTELGTLSADAAASILWFCHSFVQVVSSEDTSLHIVGDALSVVMRFRSLAHGNLLDRLGRYVVNFVATVSICHTAYLWNTRELPPGIHLQQQDVNSVCRRAWSRLRASDERLAVLEFKDVETEAISLLNVGLVLHMMDDKIRMSFMLHPFFQLPALEDHWAKLCSDGELAYLALVMVDPSARKGNVFQMVYDLCKQVHPTSDPVPPLMNFLLALNDSNEIQVGGTVDDLDTIRTVAVNSPHRGVCLLPAGLLCQGIKT
ncbi:hypothetical protein C8R45DRAFT_1112559 [Mycena sanguinolenta]|nr:hypothetical protein C8R45DRAFT_1112559 [Mycena sanguinolenta]